MIGFVTCVKPNENHLYPDNLRYGKVYEVVTPEPTDPAWLIRIIDESGEEDLYLREWFRD